MPDFSKVSESELEKLQKYHNECLLAVSQEIGKREAVGEFSKLQREFQKVMQMNMTISQKIQEMAPTSASVSPNKTPWTRDGFITQSLENPLLLNDSGFQKGTSERSEQEVLRTHIEQTPQPISQSHPSSLPRFNPDLNEPAELDQATKEKILKLQAKINNSKDECEPAEIENLVDMNQARREKSYSPMGFTPGQSPGYSPIESETDSPETRIYYSKGTSSSPDMPQIQKCKSSEVVINSRVMHERAIPQAQSKPGVQLVNSQEPEKQDVSMDVSSPENTRKSQVPNETQ